jgi:hypothetical protein
LLAVFWGTFGLAGTADNKSTITDQFFNGRMWQLLNASQKSIHLTGIQEGILLCLSQIKEDLLIPPDVMQSMEKTGLFERRRLLFSSMGVTHISDRVDVFYQNAEYLDIPIIEAYRHVTLGLNFAAREDLENDLAKLKRKYKK